MIARWRDGVMAGVLLLIAAAAGAQTPQPRQSAGAAAEVEPIRCWWRTSAGAVSIGEPFSVTVTCAVYESGPVQVVPDESALTVSGVQLAPFEVIGGSHPADLRTEQRRFFQYEYTVRLIDPDAIGRDVKLPDLQIHYRVHRVGEADASVEGRDQLYLLQGTPVRILSRVPVDAPDIRDGSEEAFGRVEALAFRSRFLQIAAIALAALGVIVLVPAVARLLGQAREKPAAGAALMPARTLLRHAAIELTAVQRESRQGWTLGLATRAAVALRIAAVCALGRRTSQRTLARGDETPAGRLLVTRGWLRTRMAAVSSPVSTLDLARELERLPAAAPLARRELVERLHAALQTFTSGLYGNSRDLDGASLDAALEQALASVTQLNRAQAWPRHWFSGRVGRIANPESVA